MAAVHGAGMRETLVVEVSDRGSESHVGQLRLYTVLAWSSVKNLKLRLHEETGVHLNRMRLYFGNTELRDDARMNELVGGCMSATATPLTTPRTTPSARDGGVHVATFLPALAETPLSGARDFAPAPAPGVPAPSPIARTDVIRLVLTVMRDRSVRSMGAENGSIHSHSSFDVPISLVPVFDQVQRAFDGGCIPKLAMDGSGGTYFLRGAKQRAHSLDSSRGGSDSDDEYDDARDADAWTGSAYASQHRRFDVSSMLPPMLPRQVSSFSAAKSAQQSGRWPVVACFKPSDEEPGCENNPRGLVGRRGQNWGLRRGVRAGEACAREVAAYLLDHGGFSNVPPAVMAVVAHKSLNYAMRPRAAAEYVSSDDEWSSSDEEIDVSLDGDFTKFEMHTSGSGSNDASEIEEEEEEEADAEAEGRAASSPNESVDMDDDSCSSSSCLIRLNTLPALLPRLGSHSSLSSAGSGSQCASPLAVVSGKRLGRLSLPLPPLAPVHNPFACDSPSSGGGGGGGGGSSPFGAVAPNSPSPMWKAERQRQRVAKRERQGQRRQRLRTSSLWVDGKIGSLQRFVEHNDVAGNIAPHLFPASEVHRLAILDIRLMNTDRNDANILVQYQDFHDDEVLLESFKKAASSLQSRTSLTTPPVRCDHASRSSPTTAQTEIAHIHNIVWEKNVGVAVERVGDGDDEESASCSPTTPSVSEQASPPTLLAPLTLSPPRTFAEALRGDRAVDATPPSSPSQALAAASAPSTPGERGGGGDTDASTSTLSDRVLISTDVHGWAVDRSELEFSPTSAGWISSASLSATAVEDAARAHAASRSRSPTTADAAAAAARGASTNPSPGRFRARTRGSSMGSESDDGYFDFASPRAWKEGEVKLIPIDHGYSMPDNLEIAWCDWCWFEWPQINEPLSDEMKQFVLALDPDAEAQMLREHLQIREPCLLTLNIGTTLLKKGVALGLTLYEIASIVVRDDLDAPSELERLDLQAKSLAAAAMRSSRSGSLTAFGVDSIGSSRALVRSISSPSQYISTPPPSSPTVRSKKDKEGGGLKPARLSSLMRPPTLMRVMSAPVDLSRMGTVSEPTLGGVQQNFDAVFKTPRGTGSGGSVLHDDSRFASAKRKATLMQVPADRAKESFKQLYR